MGKYPVIVVWYSPKKEKISGALLEYLLIWRDHVSENALKKAVRGVGVGVEQRSRRHR